MLAMMTVDGGGARFPHLLISHLKSKSSIPSQTTLDASIFADCVISNKNN